MTQKDDGGSAFPVVDRLVEFDNTGVSDERGYYAESVGGMSLRDYFAAQALAGMVACGKGWPMNSDADEIATRSFALADAMLKARSDATGDRP